MSEIKKWIFVDDLTEEAQAFASHLNEITGLEIEVLTPAAAKRKLLEEKHEPRGVLMDIDLSAIPGEVGSGPGIAQDIRVLQKSNKIPDYPIVRFAALEKVRINVKGDPTSDDLFDLKMEKESVSRDPHFFSDQVLGVRNIYDLIIGRRYSEDFLSSLFGCDEECFSRWGHDTFYRKLKGSAKESVHVAAGYYIRCFILLSGLLVDEKTLSVRLGVDIETSRESWRELKKYFDFDYKGAGEEGFHRWWARGLEDWWYSNVDNSGPLISLSSEQRVEKLNRKYPSLEFHPIVMPGNSPGDKPWGFCFLGKEEEPPRYIPIDPNESVRYYPEIELPVWLDPLYVSLKLALQQKDYRLDADDLQRLTKKYSVRG